MTELNRLQSDLGYVREIVDRSAPPAPTAVYWMWALIVLVGFSLPDFAPNHVATFWTVAGPLGFLVSMVLGARHARRTGQMDWKEGARHLLHWGTMLGVIGLSIVLVHRGMIRPEGVGPMVLLITGLTYLLAALHLDRLLLLPGLLMVAGFGVLLYVDRYSWTIVGVLVAVGLAFAGVAGGRTRGER